MKLFLITLFVGLSVAANLSGRYLPPVGGSGGHGGFLQGPFSGGSHGSSHGSGGTGLSSGVFGGGHSSGGAGISGGAFSGAHGSGSALSGGAYGGGTGSAYGGGAGVGAFGATSAYSGHHSSNAHIPILEYENVNNGDGSYHFKYATGNGISQHEQGHLNNAGTDHAEQVVEGSYSYTGDDGHTYTVHYKADANGFQPVGDHLPTPPPIPDAILKSLAYNAAHGGSDDSGAYRGAGAYGSSSGYGASAGGYRGGAVHSGTYGGGAAHGGAYSGHSRTGYNQGGSGGYHY